MDDARDYTVGKNGIIFGLNLPDADLHKYWRCLLWGTGIRGLMRGMATGRASGL